jgi:hypothetical protein
LARYAFAAIYATTVGDLATAAYLVGHPGGRCFVEIGWSHVLMNIVVVLRVFQL